MASDVNLFDYCLLSYDAYMHTHFPMMLQDVADSFGKHGTHWFIYTSQSSPNIIVIPCDYRGHCTSKTPTYNFPRSGLLSTQYWDIVVSVANFGLMNVIKRWQQ